MIWMAYLLTEIEVAGPLPHIRLGGDDGGLAVVLRQKGRLVDFWMEPLPGSSEVPAHEVRSMIESRSPQKLLMERLREQLPCPSHPQSIPSLTIAICTKDRADYVARCLASLEKMEASPYGPPTFVEILIVDNAPSDDRTRTLAEAHSGVRYVCESKPGLDFARNKALEEAKGELLAFLDDDVVVDRSWLAGLVEAWVENPDAGAFTGLVLPYELKTKAQVLFELRGGFRKGFKKIRYGQHLPGNRFYPCGPGIFGTGANMAFRRDVLLALGGFDEALDTGRPLPGGGDLDIYYRIIRAGYPLVYEPQYAVFHEHRRELEGLRRQYWSWGLGVMAFVVKSYKTDRENRPKLRGLVRWWFNHKLRQILASLRGRHILDPSLIWAELWGGIQGLCGEYHRSIRRVSRIKKQIP